MYDSEIRARLGIDGSSIPGDLQKARGAFQKFGNDVQKDAEKTGGLTGDKLIGKLEHKIFGARHLSGALAAALGLNIEKISEKIAAAITGGSAEGWKAAGEIAEENSKRIQKAIERNMSPARLAEYYKREIEKANEEAENVGKHAKSSLVNRATFGLLGNSTKVLDAEQLEEQQKAQARALEAQEKLDDLKKDSSKTVDKLGEAQRKYDDEHGTAQQRIARLNADILNLQWDMEKAGLTQTERDEMHIKLLEKQTQLEKEQKEVVQKKAEQEEKVTAQKIKQTNLAEDLRRDRDKLKEDQGKLSDRTKLTLGELADLKGGGQVSSMDEEYKKAEENRRQAFTFGADSGLSADQVKARDKAKEIKELEKRAEQARLSGDQQGAGALLDQVGTMREDLVNSGFTKSTQGDESKALREQITKDNFEIKKVLTEIAQTEKGRYTNTP
jgi:hypothetical protein